jgi:hypothetical protein
MYHVDFHFFSFCRLLVSLKQDWVSAKEIEWDCLLETTSIRLTHCSIKLKGHFYEYIAANLRTLESASLCLQEFYRCIKHATQKDLLQVQAVFICNGVTERG